MLSPNVPVERVELRGRRVALEPLSAEYLPGLAAAIRDGELWSIPVTLVPHPDDLPEFLKHAEARYAAHLERAFATVDLESGVVVGSTRFMAINRDHRRCEIGFTFLAQQWQRSHVNTEAKYLMLRHAFEEWECNRVEFLTDVLNSKSRQAILRLGAKEEGVIRNHMIMRDGRVRDSVLYGIIRSNGPEYEPPCKRGLRRTMLREAPSKRLRANRTKEATVRLLRVGLGVVVWSLAVVGAAAQSSADGAAFVLRVDSQGSFFLDDTVTPLDEASVLAQAVAALRRNADVALVVEGDLAAPYQRVTRAAVLLQEAGAKKIAFRTTRADQR